MTAAIPLDLSADPIDLTAALVDIASESHHEAAIADAVEHAIREQTSGFEVLRHGNRVLARTNRGLASRVILAGHLDTVPIADNVPSRRESDGPEGDVLHGCGTVDMKSGDAAFLHLAATMADCAHDLTLIFYDCEEIAAVHNGLGFIERELPDWLVGDVAILGEPTAGLIEAGCQGTLRVRLTARGTRSHSARSWMGDNAIHKLGQVLQVLADYRPRRVDIDGCEYREGLSAVAITGGVAGNVIPDAAAVDVNFRFAPDRSADAAYAHVREVFARQIDSGTVEIELTDSAPGALPGLSHPAAQALVAAAHGQVRAKYGWTDVSRFAAMGIPAVNLGPGDPNLAHRRDERVPTAQITAVTDTLRRYLSTPA
ncbi:succinyl-diaminopimelate desuccinylase [Williamsia phyllosphaerae]|uniref:Succinyl-diaminopimelate desuccinylase n=1 Tax=Williamsia phyllosphaerae TaxID=885042 RepID=A0ABQ1UV46_9NOCA|nr:succinyl-diaminopimelate desuccinylase [Williamsia phyllosphaerae]GGF26912.1 putative succinyl-diaminopimelate desuccinylase [Williamsia phyllosphaerae]